MGCLKPVGIIMLLLAFPPSIPETRFLKFVCLFYVAGFHLVMMYMVYFQLMGRFHPGSISIVFFIDIPTICLGIFECISLTFANTFATLSVINTNGHHDRLLRNIRKLHNLTSQDFPEKVGRKKIIIFLSFMNIFYLLLFTLHRWSWAAKFISKYYDYFFFDDILRYRCTVCVLYVNCLLEEVKNGVQYICKILSNAEELCLSIKSNASDIQNGVIIASKAYGVLTDITTHFNNTFGCCLLLLNINCLLIFLISFNLCLKNDVHQTYLITYLLITVMVMMMVHALVLIVYLYFT